MLQVGSGSESDEKKMPDPAYHKSSDPTGSGTLSLINSNEGAEKKSGKGKREKWSEKRSKEQQF